MHCNIQSNDLDQIEERNIGTVLKSNSTTILSTREAAVTALEITIDDKHSLSKEQCQKKIRNSVKNGVASEEDIYTGTTTSCTSSTDSGVNISDNDEVQYQPSPTSFSRNLKITENPFEQQLYKNTNTNIINVDYGNSSTNIENEIKSRMQQQQKQLEQQLQMEDSKSSAKDNFTGYKKNQSFIKSECVINCNQKPNVSNTSTTESDGVSSHCNEYVNQNKNLVRTCSSSSITSSLSKSSTNSSEIKLPSSADIYNSSPVVSIRSICSSTIITSDSDSECDPNDNIEGVHENYVIKKLGTQVTYPAGHPEIPNINSGHTLINQQVATIDIPLQQSPLQTLAAIGDSFGQAQALGTVPSVSGISQRPQIGSIALSNSSDVTFGDKHFYEGPVTIQQFLINGRDKWKDNSEKNNPTFENDNSDSPNKGK